MIRLKLKEYLTEKKISIHWLANAIGVRYGTVYDIVHSRRRSINLEILEKIMNVLNINDISIIIEKQKNK